MSTALERFRRRFRGVAARSRSGGSATPDDRLRAAFDLHAFNLLLTIDKVRDQMAEADEAAVLAEVNRRRMASSPMPVPLCRRAQRRDAGARSH